MIFRSKNEENKYYEDIRGLVTNRDAIFTIGCIVLLLLLFLVSAGIIPSQNAEGKDKSAQATSSQNTERPEPKEQGVSSIDTSDAKGTLYKPVARVELRKGSGSAFLIDDRHLITAHHVVGDVPEGTLVDLQFNKAPGGPLETRAEIVWKKGEAPAEANLESFEKDFAILELTAPDDIPDKLPRAKLAKTQAVELGSDVTTVGYPKGKFNMSQGIVGNNVIRKKGKKLELFKIDAGAWPGISGGPLFLNESEKVIGVVVGKQRGIFNGINVACKVSHLREILKEDELSL
jgi:V8-like Glu-specific endopeptidase